jgi:ankyrin repeat protein
LETPLHYAATKGETKCLKELINNKADVNTKENFWLETPLHYSAFTVIAMVGDTTKCLKELIKNKADVNAKNQKNQNALDTALGKGLLHPKELRDVLMESCGTSKSNEEKFKHNVLDKIKNKKWDILQQILNEETNEKNLFLLKYFLKNPYKYIQY